MATQARAYLFDLYDQDRAALEGIKKRLEISSSALCVRIAIRDLARRLSAPSQLGESQVKELFKGERHD